MGRTLYLECSSGISGDMTVAALLDLGADRKFLEKSLSSLHIGGFQTEVTRVKKSGLDACDFRVILDEEHENYDHDMEYLHGHHKIYGEHHHHEHHHHHQHRGILEIRKIILESEMTDRAKEIAVSVFEILAEAEAKAHGTAREEVHFHEVGAVDSIVDIAAAAVCLDELDITDVIVTKLYEGTGTVRCQHGVIPIPVPAVVNIVQEKGLSLQITDVEGELVTPTGVAIAAAIKTSDHLPEEFAIEKIGIGAGKRQYACPGILRAMLIREKRTEKSTQILEQDRIWKLETNVDDCTGEELGNVMRLLFEAGARDVYYTPVYMKKNRPAYELSVICEENRIPFMEDIIFEETTTIGIRRNYMNRTILKREISSVCIDGFQAKIKICTLPNGQTRCYPEYDSVTAFAEKKHISYRDAWEKIRDYWKKER
ncbi:MAG: nickel pincer cofactor biosynthesis protein LarC [Blautia sp.]|uniref:nickel pincer cofactor biosynthesis protein LarC n=1 Tax=Blautia sp. TaxID=1955243 RepID=UPI002E79D0E7|nr:nickel pincer cofactor biosynthesis protein LarC [Blautia sp.]MED9882223.1 nickel pincer cofactor biosynthesis protein LarC [Blautia sp.]